MATLASGLSARLWPSGTYTRWIPSRSFTVSSSVPPLPSFSQRDDNVGGVKQLLSIPIRALGEERHFALVEMAVPTTGSLVIVFQVRTFGPTHASLRSLTAIMITTSNSS